MLSLSLISEKKSRGTELQSEEKQCDEEGVGRRWHSSLKELSLNRGPEMMVRKAGAVGEKRKKENISKGSRKGEKRVGRKRRPEGNFQ